MALSASRRSKNTAALEARRLRALFDACQALSTSLVVEEVMDLICRGVDRAFGLTSVDIYEYDAGAGTVTAVWSFMPDKPEEAAKFVGTVYRLDEHPAMRRSFGGDIVEYHADDPEFERTDPGLFADMSRWGERSIIEAGLHFGDETVGLLSIGSTDQILRLDADEKALLGAFAATAAIAIHNAALYRAVEQQAVVDGLTGLFNHRFFYERLAAEVARGRRYGTPVALLMIDVDDFKKFNDAHGHQAGDAVLRTVAGLILGDVRRDLDAACRYGGEEFGVILPNTPVDAVQVGERLRQHIAETELDGMGRITVSVGVAIYPGHAADVEGLVRDADHALYVAKARGKDRVVLAPAEEP